jgi:polyisoprenoid-binding protein YceI
MKATHRLISLTLPLLLASSMLAQQQTFHVDGNASEVSFLLQGSDHSTRGIFHVQSGAIDFDRSTLKISGSVVVAVDTGRTGNATRDKKMTIEVLDVVRFPEISFTPQSYQGTISPKGDSTLQVSGTFLLHGTPHPLTIPMQLHIDGANCTAKTHFIVPYVKWGLKDPSVFILRVAKEVQVDLTLAGHLSPAS